MNIVQQIERDGLRRDLPPFRPGDTVRVHVKIREGDKERIQVYEGVVIRRRGGGTSASFTVRKVSYGVGVERIFPVESPAVTRVEITRRGHVRRARLYYLRELRGKKARLRSKVRDVSHLMAAVVDDEGEPGTAEEAVASAEATEVAPGEEPTLAIPNEPAEAAEAPDAGEASEDAGEAAPESDETQKG